MKPAASKRTNLPLRVDYARQFRKDLGAPLAFRRYDMNRLKAVMLIANEAPFGPEQRAHRLRGSWRATGNVTSVAISF